MTLLYWSLLGVVLVIAVVVGLGMRPAVREKRRLERGHNSMATRKQEVMEDIADATGGDVSTGTRHRLDDQARATEERNRRAV